VRDSNGSSPDSRERVIRVLERERFDIPRHLAMHRYIDDGRHVLERPSANWSERIVCRFWTTCAKARLNPPASALRASLKLDPATTSPLVMAQQGLIRPARRRKPTSAPTTSHRSGRGRLGPACNTSKLTRLVSRERRLRQYWPGRGDPQR
jgi:hypothetical protein